jgi:ADP-ribosylglycohydrolase
VSDPTAPHDREAHAEALVGALWGTSVGDAVGLPWENMSARRAARWRRGRPLEMGLLPGGKGMYSDDTEHAFMVGQALLESRGRGEGAFARALARRLRWWLLAVPGGVGWATLRGVVKLWFGASPERSGVWSAGNGPAMRAPLIGVAWRDDEEARRAHVRASSRITHRDPRADVGAQAVAEVAARVARGAWSARPELDAFCAALEACAQAEDAEWSELVGHVRASGQADEGLSGLCARIGIEGFVTGYAYHTVPVAVYAWWRHGEDVRGALEEVVAQGGDTDSVGAIVGALCGAHAGPEGVPRAWVEGLWEWPRGAATLEALGGALARSHAGEEVGPIANRWWGVPLRNAFFALVVLLHGLRRALPPY